MTVKMDQHGIRCLALHLSERDYRCYGCRCSMEMAWRFVFELRVEAAMDESRKQFLVRKMKSKI